MKDWEIRELNVKAAENKKKKKVKFTGVINCRYCGTERIVHRRNAVYCTDKCRYKDWQKQMHENYTNSHKEIQQLEVIIINLKARLSKYEEI